MRIAKLSCVLVLIVSLNAYSFSTGRLTAEQNLIINVDNRSKVSLNGKWQIIIDPYEAGYYGYRYKPLKNGYFINARPRDKTGRGEYDLAK